MFLNCGQLTPLEDGVRLEIWDGGETFEFRLAVRDVSALLQERANRILAEGREGTGVRA